MWQSNMKKTHYHRFTFINKLENLNRIRYEFSKNKLSMLGLIMVLIVLFLAIFAPLVSTHPEAVTRYVNFKDANRPPSSEYFFGTDIFGRDVFTRTIYGFRFSLMLAFTVLFVSLPFGVVLGIIAGYFHGKWVSTFIMRFTDVFLAVPPLLLAMAIAAMLTPSIVNAMIALCLVWWTWQCRLVYGLVSSIKGEYYVLSAELCHASKLHIILKEILPNCISVIITKATLDLGAIILIGASLSFVGLGAQPPTADLGTMVAEGAKYLPDFWWMALFPALGIVLIVLGFNLLGDGIRDIFAVKEV